MASVTTMSCVMLYTPDPVNRASQLRNPKPVTCHGLVIDFDYATKPANKGTVQQGFGGHTVSDQVIAYPPCEYFNSQIFQGTVPFMAMQILAGENVTRTEKK
jgi:hypothetical protein